MLLCTSFAYSNSIPSQFHDKSYEVWVGDYDGDGKDDLYLKAKRYTNTINFRKINTPLPLYKHPSYLLSNYKGKPTPIRLKLWPHNATVRGARKLSYKLIVGDFNGDGLLDILFQAPNASYPTFTLYQSRKTSSSQSIKHFPRVIEYLDGKGKGSETIDVSQEGAKIEVVNANGDRYDDLRIVLSGHREIIAQNVQGDFFINNFQVYADGPSVPGAVAGSSTVSEIDGSFSYNIPIHVPKGPSSVTPNLSIAYNSRAQSHYMGVGFQITGLSAITHCNVPHEKEDGQGKEINFDRQLCLDETPLVKRYNNTLYPEDNPGLAIKPHGQGFKSESLDYEHRYYGNTGNARIKIPGRDFGVWRLNRVEDPFGNGYNISYLDNSPENLVKQIRYNNVQINFTYVDHPFPISYVVHGKGYNASNLLKRIDVKVGNRLYTSYTFGYEWAQGVSSLRLNKIIQCGADGACLPATTFQYKKRAKSKFGFEKTVESTGVCADDKYNDRGCNGPNRESFYNYNGMGNIQYADADADADGDGRIDICYRTIKGGVTCRLQIIEYDESYRMDMFSGNISSSNKLCNDSPGSRTSECDNDNNFKTIAFIDFNKDGKADVMYRGDELGATIYPNVNGEFAHYKQYHDNICGEHENCDNDNNYYSIQTPDVNGDHIPDICYRADYKGITCVVSKGIHPTKKTPLYTQKFNVDIYANKVSDLQVTPLEGVTNAKLSKYSNHTLCGDDHYWGGCLIYQIQYHDFDKDGLDDLIFIGKEGIKVFRSTGVNTDHSRHSLFEPYLFSNVCKEGTVCYNAIHNGKGNLRFVDFNNDGWLDICYTPKMRYGITSHQWGPGYGGDGPLSVNEPKMSWD